jgi:hypothetical protein
MWKSAKAYLQFCRLAFQDKFPSKKYQLLKKIVVPLLLFVMAWVLGAYFGVPLKSIVVPIYRLLPGAAWIVIVLLLAIVFLLLLLDGARCLHARTIREIYMVQAEIIKEYADSFDKIELLTLFMGRFDAIGSLLDNRRWKDSAGPPLSKPEIQYQEADFHNKLQDYFGPDYVQEYFGRLGDIPDSVQGQTDRMRVNSNEAHRHIQSQRQHRLSIAAKAQEQKQNILRRLTADPQDSDQEIA